MPRRVLVIGVMLLWEPKPAPVLVLKRPFSTPVLLRDQLSRWIPASRSWAWTQRLGDALFGRRAAVSLRTKVFELEQPTGMNDDYGLLRLADFSAEGTGAIWFLRSDELKELYRRLQQTAGLQNINAAGITTLEGSSAELFSGDSAFVNGSTNQVGLEIGYLARVRNNGTDLFATVQFSELGTNDLGEAQSPGPALFIRTNLDIAVRLQIPKGSGVFLLSKPAGGSRGKRVGMIIDPP